MKSISKCIDKLKFLTIKNFTMSIRKLIEKILPNKKSRQITVDNPLDGAKFDYNTQPKSLLNFDGLFTIEERICQGDFATIYKVKSIKNGQFYILKELDLPDIDDLLKEIAISERLLKNCNENFVCYYDCFTILWDPKESENYNDAFLYEYIEGINLYDYINSIGQSLNDDEIFNISSWLLAVVNDLHRRGYVHRDIKPHNIMVLTKNDQPTGKYKLIDFELACDLAGKFAECDHIEYPREDIPMKKLEKDPTKYYPSVDMYNVGHVLYFIINRHEANPFHLKALKYNNDCYRQLVYDLLKTNRSKIDLDNIPTANEAYQRLLDCF